MQKRLDVYLSENNTVKSRSLAASLIKQGSVEVNGRICTKASFAVDENDNIRIIGEMPKYVGRGGMKLEKALSHYRLHLDGSVCIDIGASTGGFTDCMLQNGAVKVYSVDVGTDQLDEKLRNDPRVVSMEKTDIRKNHLSKHGIVRDSKVHKKVCDDISEFASTLGFERGEVISSPITGGDGNTEYLIYLRRL